MNLAPCDRLHPAPLGDQAADVEAPVGLEGIPHPVLALHRGQVVDNRGQMGGTIGAGACLAQMPHNLPCGHNGDRRHKERALAAQSRDRGC